jgi:hypothetical protein
MRVLVDQRTDHRAERARDRPERRPRARGVDQLVEHRREDDAPPPRHFCPAYPKTLATSRDRHIRCVGVDDDRVLAAHLATTRFTCRCRDGCGRLRDQRQPHVARARERHERRRRVLGSVGPTSPAPAGRKNPGGSPVTDLDEPQRDAGRLLRRPKTTVFP